MTKIEIACLMYKNELIADIISHLKLELDNTLDAANNALLAAIDDQSVAETQYDTLAIEASYLAEGQSKRVMEIKQAISAYQRIELKTFSEHTPIAIGALIQLEREKEDHHWFFIGPAAGGYRTQISDQHFTVVTEHSPIAKELIGRYLYDDFEMSFANNSLGSVISSIC